LKGMNIPAVVGPRSRVGAVAYLVGWQDIRTGVFTDAGIYSEPSPTVMLRSFLRPVTLCHSQSRYAPARGGYERAVITMQQVAEKTPAFQWTTRTRTYQLMKSNLRRLIEGRAVVR